MFDVYQAWQPIFFEKMLKGRERVQMKKILVLFCIICFVIDAIYNVYSKQYISLIGDVALVILALMQGSQYFKREE